jgi:hypothetical protein
MKRMMKPNALMACAACMASVAGCGPIDSDAEPASELQLAVDVGPLDDRGLGHAVRGFSVRMTQELPFLLTLRDADGLVASPVQAPGFPQTISGVALADFSDPDRPSAFDEFDSDTPFAGTDNGFDDEWFVAVTSGDVTALAEGDYIFRIGGDDGGRLRLDTNEDGLLEDAILDNRIHPFETFEMAPVSLTAGAVVPFEWLLWENQDRASGEFSYRRTTDTTWRLVGDPSGGLSASGMQSTTYKAPGVLDIIQLSQAEVLLSGTTVASRTETANLPVINMGEDPVGFPGLVADDSPFPGEPSGFFYVIEATGFIRIPHAGLYTFVVNSDDGFAMTFSGASFVSGTNLQSGGNPSLNVPGGDNFAFNFLRAEGATFGVFEFPAKGLYPVRLVFWERAGGALLELLAARGSHEAVNDDFELVGAGSIKAYASLSGGE